MSSRLTQIAGHRRQFLTEGWELCATPPGAFDGPESLARGRPDWIATGAPSTAAACLRSAGRWSLDSPARSFDSEDWWFRTRFARPEGGRESPVVLGFDGLATVADAWLNGRPILSSDNMFIAHRCPVTDELSDDNELLIRFRALDPFLEMKRPRPRWRAPMIQHQQLRWLRTTLLGRTPGWSPPAAAVGPWRPVWLETQSHFSIGRFDLRTHVSQTTGSVEVACEIVPLGTSRAIEAVTLFVGQGASHSSLVLTREGDGRTFVGRLRIPDVSLWWPHTHGAPALYDARLCVRVGPGASDEYEARLGRIGFRTISLDTRDGGFAVLVNGVRVFCRGACWVPTDPVSLSATRAQLQQTLDLVAAAGMNMLRVGGTMVYESDDFLDLCDEKGILLWQDFMFANMSYPDDDPAFVRSVATEAHQQLARFAGRPCLTMLCGNSEGEQQAAMWGAAREHWPQPLFDRTLAELAREHCPDVPYWPSSAHGGAFPHQVCAGTSSYYGVGAYLRPVEDARRSEVRFASECLAFANVPEDTDLARVPGGLSVRVHHPAWKARVPRDLGAGWDFDDVRDFYLRALFREDPLTLRYGDHARYLELSRVVPGEIMAATFGEWRRARSVCGGGLVWFLRDLWSGAGWGIVDSSGTPKAPYYYLRHALQPVQIQMSDEGLNGPAVHVHNETAESLEATVVARAYREGFQVISEVALPVSVPARSSIELSMAAQLPGFLDLTYAYRFGPASHDLIVATLQQSGSEPISRAFYFPLGLPSTRQRDVGLSAHATVQADGSLLVNVNTVRFAQSVCFDVPGFMPDDQYFHMEPGSQRTITLRRCADARTPRGSVRALNAGAAAKIEVAA